MQHRQAMAYNRVKFMTMLFAQAGRALYTIAHAADVCVEGASVEEVESACIFGKTYVFARSVFV
jgi:hypothetical protein